MNTSNKNPGNAEFDEFRHNYDSLLENSIGMPGVKADYATTVKAAYLGDLIRCEIDNDRPPRLLDVGCGIGNMHPILIKQGVEVTGVDVSRECINEAKIKNPQATYLSYDGDRLPFKDAQFDCVCAVCVVHHVPPANWDKFAAELFRILRPGGLAVIFEHNPHNPVTRHIVNRCPFDANAVLLDHLKSKSLLAGAGFAETRSASILTVPAKSRIARRIDSLFAGLNIGAQYYVLGKKPTQTHV